MSSLDVTEQKCAAVAKAPRVSLADINDAIAAEYTFRAADAVHAENDQQLSILTIHIIKMKNGFTVLGKAAPASPENFNADLGAKLAREDAIRQIWPLMGFALCEKLSGQQPKGE